MSAKKQIRVKLTDRQVKVPGGMSDVVWTITVDGEPVPYLLARVTRRGYYLTDLDGTVQGNGVTGLTPTQAARHLLDAGAKIQTFTVRTAPRTVTVRPTAHQCLPVGSRDIADRLGLQPNTVAVYTTRGMLPDPRWTVSGLPAWCWDHDIAPLLVNGRLSSKGGAA